MPSIIAAIGLVIFSIVGFLVYEARFRYGNEHNGIVQTRPPTDLPPAIAGVLSNRGSFQMTWNYALGTLFNLAERGILRIEEIDQKSWFSTRDYLIKLEHEPASLKPHERGLLDALFITKRGRTNVVRMSKLQNNIYQRLKHFSEPLEMEIKASHIFEPDRQRARNRLMAFGLVLLPLSLATLILMGFFLLPIAGTWPFLLALALFIIGLVAVVTGASISPLTESAQEQYIAWKQFSKYLLNIVRHRDTLARPGQAYTYLPYAAAFGLAPMWSNYMKKEEQLSIPAWFHAISPNPDTRNAAFIAMIAAANSSGGAASSSAAGVAGAAGAAGGGASGAG